MQSQRGESVTTKNLGTAARNTADNFNREMLSTYRGNDNMKLKIIDHSVLRDATSNSPAFSSSLRQPLNGDIPAPIEMDVGSKGRESLGTHISIPSFDPHQFRRQPAYIP